MGNGLLTAMIKAADSHVTSLEFVANVSKVDGDTLSGLVKQHEEVFKGYCGDLEALRYDTSGFKGRYTIAKKKIEMRVSKLKQ